MQNRYYHSKPLLGIFLSLFLLISAALAQTPTDVQIIQQAPWQIRTIKRGVVLKQAQFPQLFGAPQNVSVLEIDLKNRRLRLGVAAHPNKRILTSDFAKYGNALAAINGTFFNMKEGGSHMLVRVDGTVVNPTVERSERSNGAITVEAGKVAIMPGSLENKQWDAQLTAPNIMVSGPLLITNDKPAELSQAKFNTLAHPRSAVGLTKDNKLLFVTVDGRQEKARGMSLFSLTALMQTLGAADALNLDGGGSTTLYVKGVTENGIVNSPSDKEGERTVANALLLLAK